MEVSLKKLKQNASGIDYENGYRIIYFYDDNYDVGEYCKTIEGFMIGFVECNPIIDEDDIPKFISTSDLLNRYLKEIKNVDAVAIYDVNGICIDKIYNETKNKKIV